MMDRTQASNFLLAAAMDERIATTIAEWIARELELGQLVKLVEVVAADLEELEPPLFVDQGSIGVQSVERWRRPAWWPYSDLDLRSPFCAVCGQFPMMMIAEAVHPMAFCQTEGCPSFSWDPSRTYVDITWEWLKPTVQGQIGASEYAPKRAEGN